MNKGCIIFLLFLAMASAEVNLTQEEINNQWTDFKVKFGKVYKDAEDESFRKNLFAEKLKAIEEHNEKYKQGLVTYTQGVNQFTDMTAEEMRPYTHGVVLPKAKN